MRKMLMYKKILKRPGARRMTLIYSVTIDELSGSSGTVSLESYGASITVKESGEEVIVHNITLRSSEIFTLIWILASNYVTPVTLNDVVSDWINR